MGNCKSMDENFRREAQIKAYSDQFREKHPELCKTNDGRYVTDRQLKKFALKSIHNSHDKGYTRDQTELYYRGKAKRDILTKRY